MEGLRTGKKDNTRRKFGGPGPRQDNNQHKRAEAKERAEAWQKLSPVQQLKELDRRFGEGKGAGRQRARILVSIERAKARPAPEAKKPAAEPSAGGDERVKAKDRRAQERKERPNK